VAASVLTGAGAGLLLGGPAGAIFGAVAGLGIDKLARGDGMLPDTQMLAQCREIIKGELEVFNKGASVQVMNDIPETSAIPIQNPQAWLRIPDVICVFVDMKDSTKLSAATHDKETAAAYQLYTSGAVRLLDSFSPAYIDVRGDGAFALFNKGQEHRALVAAVTFKTFAREIVVKKIKELTGQDIGSHIGIDQKTVLVRKIGMKRVDGRTDRQNEVWAGKPVNMAAKLAAMSEHDEILASERFWRSLTHECAKLSCGCGKDGNREPLWAEKDVTGDPRFDFTKAYVLKSIWCTKHGAEYAESLLRV
jgi:class 3 adenylate cyclase